MNSSLDFLKGGGEMGRRMREYDWASHPLGPAEDWPRSLKTVIQIILTSRFAMWMGWGPDLIFFCNDAYLPTVGVKEGWVLGAPSSRVWAEIWADIGPRIERVITRGEATWDELLPLFLERSGFAEETYHTFSYSPIPNDDGSVGGHLCVVTEETERVIAERRMSLLRSLAAELSSAATERQLFEGVRRHLRTRSQDLPFAMIYLFDADRKRAELVCAHGAEPGDEIAPVEILLDSGAAWPARAILNGRATTLVSDLAKRFASVPQGTWPLPPRLAALVPLAHQTLGAPAGFIVVGINPYRPFDLGYRGFVELLAGQVAAALNIARAYEEERRRAEALAELDRAKTAFFSNVSHEFRTPLTLMLSPLEDLVARPEAGLRPENRELAALAHRNGLRLLKLVNTLLDFSRIEAGRAEAAYEPVDLAALTADLASTFRSAMEKAGLRLEVDAPPLREPVFVDCDMWEKIVLNLVSNAFKFTLHGGVAVRLAEREDDVIMQVADTGTGVPPEALPHLFERFYRVQGARGRTHEGSGIGLALVHELVRLHSGTVKAESAPGEGSTFTVCIPKGTSHLPAERIHKPRASRAAPGGHNLYIEEAFRWLPSEGDGDASRQIIGDEGPPQAGANAERPIILLADDNSDMREYLVRLLSTRYSVITASDGITALERARQDKPDLVLTDVMMPRLDGFGLVREIRADRALAALPVVMLSARAGEEARAEGLDAGADDYLIKPFTARELLARLGGTLAVARTRRQAAEREAELRAETAEILETMTLAFIALDEEFRYVYLNAEAEGILGFRREEVLNLKMWERFPGSELTEFGQELRRAMAEQRALHFQTFYEPRDLWFEVNAYPMSGRRLGVFFRDISASKQFEEDLRAAKEAAEAANRSKDRFLAVLSHELRTPLSPVLLCVSAMQEEPDLPPAVREDIVMIRRNIELETRLIDDLLDLSRIVNGKLALHVRPVHLNDKVNDVVRMCREQILEKAIRLHVSLDPRAGSVPGDPSRIQQVLWNVLKNAAKFTPERGEIYVATAVTPEGAGQVVVRDTGIGLEKEALEGIFDAFEQASPEITREFGGLGLGLAISKLLVEMHGGSIRAQSPGPGKGATFTILFPNAREASEERPPQASGALPEQAREARVLIVEDNADTARVLGRLLTARGYTVRITGSVAEAVTVLAEPFDMIISDVGLPDGTGYDLMRRAREIRPIRGIAMSGYGMEEDVVKSREAGFAEHLVKPVDVIQIDEAIRRLLRGGS
jgi:PAS domain S-box-containing protein